MSSTSSGRKVLRVVVFLDDSNLWIGGATLAGKNLKDAPRNDKGDAYDVRYRLDFGRLQTGLLPPPPDENTDVRLVAAHLFGSRPPPNDSVWNAAKSKGIRLHIKTRSVITGREKQVDTGMTDEMTASLYEMTPTPDNPIHIIVLSSDGDLLPPIQRAVSMANKGVSVTIASWKHNMPREFIELESKSNDCVRLLYLNSYNVGFTSTRSTVTLKDLDKARCFVLMKFAAPPFDDAVVENRADALLRQLYRVYYVKVLEPGDVIVSLPHANSDAAVAELNALYEGLVVAFVNYNAAKEQPLAFKRFETRRFKEQQATLVRNDDDDGEAEAFDDELNAGLAANGVVAAAAASDGVATTQNSWIGLVKRRGMSKVEEENGWELVSRTRTGVMKRRDERKATDCVWGVHCSAGGECTMKHSEFDEKMFRKYQLFNMKNWKVTKCVNGRPHKNDECFWWHSEEEKWCKTCRVYGIHSCKAELE